MVADGVVGDDFEVGTGRVEEFGVHPLVQGGDQRPAAAHGFEQVLAAHRQFGVVQRGRELRGEALDDTGRETAGDQDLRLLVHRPGVYAVGPRPTRARAWVP